MTYRGSKYMCKSCASRTAPMPMTAEPDLAEMTMVEDEGIATARGRRKRERSRYDMQLRVKRLIKRLLLFGILLAGVAAAYLPQLMIMAVENTYTGILLDQKYAPKMVILAARIHIVYRRPEEAISLLENSLDQLPEEEQALSYFYLGKVYFDTKDVELTIKYLDEFIKRWPRHDLTLEAGEMIEEAERVGGMKRLNTQDKPRL